MNLKTNLILASKSPRRQKLLKEAGFDFQVKTKEVDESFPEHLSPTEVAEYIAENKAKAFERESKGSVVLTADTIVVLNDNILGKPANFEEAFSMIKSLSGKSHEVITGCCIAYKEDLQTFHDSTTVYFKELTDKEITHYINEYKPYDKAGAYGIQEWIGMIGITKIEGSYFNVVGLPIHSVYKYLSQFS